MPAEPSRLGPRPVEKNPAERRKNTRYPFTSAAEVVELQSHTMAMGRSSDLGRGGCFIDTITPHPHGTLVTVRLTTAQRTFEAQAKVVYSQVGMGMGLAFTSIQPESLRLLERWIGELSGQMLVGTLPVEPVAKPQASQPALGAPASDFEPRFVLNELIITLMRKRVLSEAEGKSLLQKLMS